MRIALDVAAQSDRGVIVALLPDSGVRYLTTSVWQIPEADRQERILQ